MGISVRDVLVCLVYGLGAILLPAALQHSDILEECQGQQIELVFMQDSSVSIDKENFDKAKSFIAEVVKHLPVGPDNVRVALVKYGYKATVIADLSSSSDVSAVTEAVMGMNYVGGGTNTGSALQAVRDEVLIEKRPLARAVLVVITDGAKSTRKSTNEAARMLREDGVRMVWLYVTQNGTAAMWREKLRMSASGDTTLEVFTFDDLGQDDVRHILVATCRENFDPDMTTVAPTTAPRTPATLTSAESPTSPAISETSSNASLPGSSDAGLGESQSSEEPATVPTELGGTTGQGDTASSQTVGEEAGQISTNSSENSDEETVKANTTSDQEDVQTSSQPFNQEGQPSTSPSTQGLNETTSTADSATTENSDDESSSPPSTPEQPSTKLTTEADDEALETGSSPVPEETDQASSSSSTPGQPSTDSTTKDDSETSSEDSDATDNGDASTTPPVSFGHPSANSTAEAGVETPEEDPAATEKGNASSSSSSGPGLPSAANSTTNSDDESATEGQPDTSSSSYNPEQPSANATTQADEESSKADSDTTEQADPSSSTPSSPGQPSGSSTTSTHDDRSEAGSTASEKTGVSPSSTSNPGQPSTNSATEANDDEPSETGKGDGSPTSPPQGLDSRKPSTDTISGVSKADTASNPTGTARTEMEGEHGAKTQEEGGSSTSVIAGIVVGVLLGAVGVGAVAWLVLWKRKGKTGKDADSCP